MSVLRGRADAFGSALLDHLTGRDHGPALIERDDGFVEAEFASKYFEDFRHWGPLERAAMRSVRGRVLDIGCGGGRVALHLQRRGHDVVGIDVSTLAVKVCALRGVTGTRVMSATQADRRLGAFDTIVMMGNNLGLLASPERARWLLRRFRRLTREGGRIVGTSSNPYQTDDPDHLRYHRLNRRRRRMGGQVRMRIRYRTLATPWFDYLFLSPEELGQIVNGTGWHLTRLMSGSEYVAVLEKDG